LNREINSQIDKHIRILYNVIFDAYNRKYKSVTETIEKEYIKNRVFTEEYYREADDFIFRMDVTELSYSQTFELSYGGLKNNNYKEYLLGLTIVASKLKGNQRYTYFDREKMKDLMNKIADENSIHPFIYEEMLDQKYLHESISNYMPIGMDQISMDDYRSGSQLSIYDKYEKVQNNVLEKEFEKAVKSGNIYHHIVETDRFINKSDNGKNKEIWVHLTKLLVFHYATEKAGWTKDLTESLLKSLYGLKDNCEEKDFNELFVPLIILAVKTAVKRITALKHKASIEELREVINFISNADKTVSSHMFKDYIQLLEGLIEKLENHPPYNEVP
jgi:hypothetical protein